jgi:hypothetical protein
MSTNIKFFLLCPIPEDQKPINEYIGLKENSLTNWTTLSKKQYENKIRSLLLVILGGVSFFNLSDLDLGITWIVNNLFITSLIFVIFCWIVIFRWSQAKKRFNSSRLFYEEVSWYDGQIWDKPLLIIKNDRLISTQKITPILSRLKRTTYFFSYVSFLLFLLIIL